MLQAAVLLRALALEKLPSKRTILLDTFLLKKSIRKNFDDKIIASLKRTILFHTFLLKKSMKKNPTGASVRLSTIIQFYLLFTFQLNAQPKLLSIPCPYYRAAVIKTGNTS